MNLREMISPVRDDGGTDARYVPVVDDVMSRVGPETVNELSDFYRRSQDIESGYEISGLRLVYAMFQVEMDRWQLNAMKSVFGSVFLRLDFVLVKSRK